MPYLKFHPTLAPALWSRLSPEAKAELLARHRQQYALLSDYLYFEDYKHPDEMRAIAQRELPNLMYAVHGALDASEEWAVEFAKNVDGFLDCFGLNRDRILLTQRVELVSGEVGSQTWILARTHIGEQLHNAGRYQEAAQVFNEILAALGEEPSYNRCLTLTQMGRCFTDLGQAAQAVALYRQGLSVSRAMYNLADLLQNQPNRLQEARQLAEEVLAIQQTLDRAAAEIWKIYNVLAEIADKQGDTTKAKEYRCLSREAKAAFQGTKYELQKYGQFIATVVATVDEADVREQLEPSLEEIAKRGWGNLVAAIHRLLEGERDEDVLCERLHYTESMIISAILRGIADPETLKPLLEGQE